MEEHDNVAVVCVSACPVSAVDGSTEHVFDSTVIDRLNLLRLEYCSHIVQLYSPRCVPPVVRDVLKTLFMLLYNKTTVVYFLHCQNRGYSWISI